MIPQNQVIYLCAPYTHSDWHVVFYRIKKVNLIAGHLINKGFFIFSPISHCHEIAMACHLPTDFDFWQRYNKAMIDACDCLLLATLAGWRESKGVTGEISYARQRVKNIYTVDAESYKIEMML